MRLLYIKLLSVFIFLGISFLGFGQCPPNLTGLGINTTSVTCPASTDGIITVTFSGITPNIAHTFRLFIGNTFLTSKILGAGAGPYSATFTGLAKSNDYNFKITRVGCVNSVIPELTNIIIGGPPTLPDDGGNGSYSDICLSDNNQGLYATDYTAIGGTGTWVITGPNIPTYSPDNHEALATIYNLAVGTYNGFWVVSFNGCGAPFTSPGISFDVNPNPTISSTLTSTVCSGLLFNYTTTSTVIGSTFQWDRVVNPSISNPVSSGIDEFISEVLINTSSVPQLVFYNLQATGPGATACTGIPSVLTVTVNPTPVANATPSSDTKCSGQQVNFALSSNLANTTYTWVTSITSGLVSGINSGSGGIITDIPVNTTNASASYDYIVTPQNTLTGCSALTPFIIPVTINPLPTVVGITTPTVCGLSSTLINLNTNGTSFNWSSGQSTNPATLTPSALGLNTFTATITSGLSCSVTTTVGIYAETPVTVQGINATVCGLASANISLLTNGASINWFDGSTTNSIAVLPVVFGINNYPATISSTVCSVTTVVSVLAQPLVTVTSTNTTVCGLTPTSVSLTTNGSGFLWNTGQVTNPATLTPTIFGLNTFTATVTSGVCSVVTSVGIVSNAPISISAPATATVCGLVSASVTLTTNGANFSWSDGQTINPVNLTPSIFGLNTFTATVSSGLCSVTTTVGIFATNFSVSVSGNPVTPICSGSPINVTASSVPAGASFDWTTQLVSGVASGYSDVLGSNSINQTLTSTGIGIINYSVTGTLNGCQASMLFTVTVNPFVSQPSFISGTANRCQGGGTDIYQTDLPAALNATSIAWTVSPALAGTDTESPGSQYVTTINWNAGYSGNVTLTAIATGCAGSQQMFSTVIGVNVSPNFISQISQQNNSCISNNGIISATVLSALTSIRLNNSINPSSFSGGIATYPNLSPGLYYIVMRNSSGCTTSSVGYNITAPITPSAPVVVSAPSGNYCSAQTIPDISLTIPAGLIGLYQSGALLTTTSSLTNYSVPTGIGSYNYSANVTVNGCVSPNIPPVNYTVNISPTITGISGTDPTSCNSNDGSITVTGTAALFTIGASSNATGIFSNLAPITQTIVASNGSCTVSGTLTLTAPGQPSPPILDGGNTYCAGQTVTQLTATSTISGTFGLYDASNTLVETQVGTSVIFNTTSAGTYYANISVSGCGSAQSNTESIIINPSPSISISGNTPVCIGNIITVTANAGIGANYDWSDGQTGNIAFFSTSTAFAANATLLGCSASLGFVTTVNSNPVVSITPGATSVCANSSFTFNGNGANTYTWLPSGITAPSLTIGITTVTTVSVIGTDLNGCIGTDQVTIQINSTITALDFPVGNTSFCSAAQTFTYSLPNVKTFYNASTINWTISPAAAGTINVSAAPNEHIASVDWNAGFSGIATISIIGIDACGNSSSNFIEVTVTSSPSIVSVGTTDPSTCSSSDGSITISGIASSGSITYINLTSNTTIASGIFSNLSASPTSTYNFTVLDVINGCFVNTSASLNPTGTPPTPSIAGGNSYCSSDIVLPIDVTSSVSGDITIYIVPGIFVASITGTSLSIIPSVSGDYFATLAIGGCTSNNSPTETVTFNSSVTQPNSPNPVSICVGSSIPLSIIDGLGFYTWYGDTLDVYNGTDVIATSTVIGSNLYTVTGIVDGCPSLYIFTVNGISPPTISLTTANQTICGDNIDLSFLNTGGTSLTYFDGFVETTIAIAGNSFNVPLAIGSNDFTLVSVSGGLCGSGTASGTVNIYRRDDTDPICTCSGKGALIGGSGSVCEGGSSTFNLVISVSGISPLSVEIYQNGDINNLLTFSGLNPGISSNLSVSPSVTTDYTIYSVNTPSCQGSGVGSIRINVTPVPLLSVTSPVILNCSTNSADLNNYFIDLNTTLVGTVSYWGDANYTIPISNTVTTTGTYYIRKIASGLSTCTGEAAISVTFQSTPTGQIFGGGAFCSGQNASLNFQFTGGSAPYSFTYGNATLTSAVITSSGIYTTNVIAENTIYTVSGISDANGCAISSSGSAVVSLNPTSLCGGNVICTTAPSAPVLSQQAAQCGEILVNWTPILADYFTYSLQSISGNVFSSGTTTGFNNLFTALTAGSYNVIVSASNSCGTSLESTLSGINVNAALSATITGGGIFCAGNDVILSIAIAGGIAPYQVNFTNGSSNKSNFANFTITAIASNGTKNYTIASIDNLSGCSNLAASIGTDITGIPLQIATLNLTSKFNSSCQDGIFVFSATGSNAGANPSFIWKINGNSILGVNHTILGLSTLGNSEVISLTGFTNGDVVSAQMFVDPLVGGCVINGNSINSNTLTILIENLDFSKNNFFVRPTSCNNSTDGVLEINVPSKYQGRNFNYSVNTVVGIFSSTTTIPGLSQGFLDILITDTDNPQCFYNTTIKGTSSYGLSFATQAINSGCNDNNGTIVFTPISSDINLTFNTTLFGVNTITSNLYVVSVVSIIANNSYSFSKIGVGLYQIFVDYDNSICSESLTLITITGGGAPVVDLGPDRNICKGDSIVITTSGIGGGLFTWMSNDSTLKASSENFLGVKPLQNTVYSVVVPGSSGCVSTDFISINVAEIKMLLATTTIASDTSVKVAWTYVNKTALPDTLFRIESRTISNNVFSPWVLEDTTSLKDTISVSFNGLTKSSVQEYRVIARNNAVCASIPHDLVYLAGLRNEENSTVSLNWTPYKGWIKGVDHYEIWRKIDDEAGFSFLQNAALDTIADLSNVNEGFMHEYRILAVSKEPIADSIKSWSNIISLEFNRQIEAYNAFSPNGDGKNDFYEVKNILSWTNNEIFVFNRWGGKVYYAKPYKNDWNGEGMPDGTYFYIIRLNDKNNVIKKGSILLQR